MFAFGTGSGLREEDVGGAERADRNGAEHSEHYRTVRSVRLSRPYRRCEVADKITHGLKTATIRRRG